MIDLQVLDLVEKGLVTDQIVLTIGYDIENLTDPEISKYYKGEVTTDHYGRKVPKHAQGTANLPRPTSSSHIISDATIALYDRIVDKKLLVRRITIAVCKLIRELDVAEQPAEQLTLFDDPEEIERKRQEEEAALAREKKIQKSVIDIKNRFGKNAILKGMNFEDGATAKERNSQVGGHKA